MTRRWGQCAGFASPFPKLPTERPELPLEQSFHALLWSLSQVAFDLAPACTEFRAAVQMYKLAQVPGAGLVGLVGQPRIFVRFVSSRGAHVS